MWTLVAVAFILVIAAYTAYNVACVISAAIEIKHLGKEEDDRPEAERDL